MMRWTWSRIRRRFSAVLLVYSVTCPVTVYAENSKKTLATHIAVLEGTEGGAHISIEFTRTPTYTARLEQGGRRLILDVPNADLKGVPPALTNQVGVVGGVMAQTFKTKQGTTTRFLITLL